MQTFIEGGGKRDRGMEKRGGFGSCRQRKIWIAATKFDEFCNQKFDKRGILFCTGFVERLR